MNIKIVEVESGCVFDKKESKNGKQNSDQNL